MPVSAGQRVLGARAALLIRPVSTVVLPITDQGQGQAVAGAARHLPLPTAWGGTAWCGEGRQAEDADKGSQRSPQTQKPEQPCPQVAVAGNRSGSLGSRPRTHASVTLSRTNPPLGHCHPGRSPSSSEPSPQSSWWSQSHPWGTQCPPSWHGASPSAQPGTGSSPRLPSSPESH